MTADEVRLSRAAAQVVDLLTLDVRIAFTDAVMRARSIGEVVQPYRGWIENPSTVPTEARRVLRGRG